MGVGFPLHMPYIHTAYIRGEDSSILGTWENVCPTRAPGVKNAAAEKPCSAGATPERETTPETTPEVTSGGFMGMDVTGEMVARASSLSWFISAVGGTYLEVQDT